MNHILYKSEGRIHWFIEYWNDETKSGMDWHYFSEKLRYEGYKC